MPVPQTDLLLVLAPDLQQLAVVLLLQPCHLRLKLQLQSLLQLLEFGLLLPAHPPQLFLKPPLQVLLLLLQLLAFGCVEGWQRAESL